MHCQCGGMNLDLLARRSSCAANKSSKTLDAQAEHVAVYTDAMSRRDQEVVATSCLTSRIRMFQNEECQNLALTRGTWQRTNPCASCLKQHWGLWLVCLDPFATPATPANQCMLQVRELGRQHYCSVSIKITARVAASALAAFCRNRLGTTTSSALPNNGHALR